jgi:thiamine monophosphate synthase
LLGIIKFNLLSKNWENNVFALGGISFLNLKKLQMTKIKGFAFNSLITNNPQIKKPVLFFRRERV